MNKPLVTFTVTAYNQENFLTEAINGAFRQTYSPLEIILSDDCSNDRSFQIMKKLAREYNGPHEIILNKNATNLGIAAHTNKLVEMANGEIIVFADGDDISYPNRTQRSIDILEKFNDCNYLNFDYDKSVNFDCSKHKKCIVEKFDLNNFDLLENFPVGGATTIRKSIYKLFGPLELNCPVQDSPIQLRYLLAGPIFKCYEPQIFYRIHDNNLTRPLNKYLIDYERIHFQYLLDLNCALDIGFVNKQKYDSIYRLLKIKLERKKIESFYYTNNEKFKIYCQSILFSKAFSVKAKLSFLKKVMKFYLKKL